MSAGLVTSQTAVLVCLTCITGAKGLNAGGGYQLNALDVSPKLAGFVHGVMNMCGQLTGWLAPIALGWMTRYPSVGEFSGSREQWEAAHAGQEPPESWLEEMRGSWRVVFLMAALIDAAGLIFFLIWAKGERQWWDVKGKM